MLSFKHKDGEERGIPPHGTSFLSIKIFPPPMIFNCKKYTLDLFTIQIDSSPAEYQEKHNFKLLSHDILSSRVSFSLKDFEGTSKSDFSLSHPHVFIFFMYEFQTTKIVSDPSLNRHFMHQHSIFADK